VVVFPNCKINLGLNIVRKRSEDEFHDLETVFYPIRWYDGLEVIKKQHLTSDMHAPAQALLSTSGLEIDDPKNNSCIKAYSILKREFPEIVGPVDIHLHKTIPAGAGLGGGSSDAAFTLTVLDRIFSIGLNSEQLLNYARLVGSDCPFFILNKPCFGTGRGDILSPIALDLSLYKLVLVHPGIHVSTNKAFSLIKPSMPSKSIISIIQQPVNSWEKELKNDFENPVFDLHPEIRSIKEKLYDAGAVYASMTGSGSSVYGLFEKTKTIVLSFPSDYLTKELTCESQ